MFAKLKKKIAEEAATVPRSGAGGRIPRSVSKESITSVGADSGDDFASDGSSSRDDLSSQLLRRNYQIRKLEAKLSDYAEQLRILQKTKEKLEIALEKHQDSSMRKLQEQNEAYQASRAKMSEGMERALEAKDQEWKEKLSSLEQEKSALTLKLDEMMEQSLNLFQKRDEIDELEGFQQQELSKVKHMLISKEDLLMQREKALEKHVLDLKQTREELRQTSEKLASMEESKQCFETRNRELQTEREELLATHLEAEKKITELEKRGQELQTVVQQVSEDFQKAQSAAAMLEKTLSSLQSEHESLKLQHKQHKQKMANVVEEKDKQIAHLQVKVSSLEKRIDGNLSEDEHLQELLKEKSSLEQMVEEARQQLLETRTSHSETVCLLEAQISKLNSKVAEVQTLLKCKDDSARSLREQSENQISELEQRIQECNEKLKKSEEQINDKEAQIKKLYIDFEAERNKLQQHIAVGRHQNTEKVNRLEAQISALETAREFDKTAAQHSISQLEQENKNLKEIRTETENTLMKQEAELERAKAELRSRETVSVEIAKALEETQKQKEELQQQVTKLTITLNDKDQSVIEKTEELTRMEEDMKHLNQEFEAVQSQLQQRQIEIESMRRTMAGKEGAAETQLNIQKQEVRAQTEQLETCQTQVVHLEAEVQALNERLNPPEDAGKEQNGAVTADDVSEIQRVNRELEQQVSEKNKTIKQLQQRLAELKKTLLKELKIKPEAETAGVKERLGPEPPTIVSAATTVINNSDISDSREINFAYLKHVVLKFMSSREAEAYQLIKAVSMLLNFTREEEDMLKQTLEYKMSWFGSKPSPKGIIRPSVSGDPTHWN
ncbi:golgin subfamily A member 1-like [Polyodon spathula]|uniref:golgin subfamily A member 1-like n=1 Tax=Polyodon spathula TaxID=7913 RepID=UPI001B7F73D3|nr:golgin subfamily A member 1-like [Polyodon spathula]XP_041090287.1 golgin subfamily A member 1-like [Polyodon spathula]